MSLSKGSRLGPYEITGQIGAGGMGEVYRATDTRLGRDVAIKTLPAALASDQDRLARFEREATLLAALNHPHIASIFGLDEHEGSLYLAMELVEGETLEDRLKGGALPVEESCRLALQIAEALEAAHDKGVVHRDLKPANVMVTGNGQVKVLDFGLAKAFSTEPEGGTPANSPALSVAMTQAGLVLGTAGYMAPEQASGQPTDQRADIWAFGVVLYEMLTGLPLFSGESVPHILADVLKTEPDWKRLPRNLHPRVRQALERCLEKRPRLRYAGITDARADIEAALKDPRGVIVPEAAVAGVAAPIPAQRRLLPWAAGLALAVVAGLAAWTLKPPPFPEPKPVVRTTAYLAEQRTFNFFPSQVILDIAPDGRHFVYASSDGMQLRSLDRFEAGAIPGIVGSSPLLSPDGSSLVYRTGSTGETVNGSVVLRFERVPITGGAPRSLAIVSDGTIGGLGQSWEADGSILYAIPDGIWRLAENGGTPERIIEFGAEQWPTAPFNLVAGQLPSWPSLLPGGEWVLFSLVEFTDSDPDWDTADIVAESLVTGERRVIYSGGSAARYVPTGHLVYAIGNTLYASRFDVDALEVLSGPVPVVQDIQRDDFTGVAHYAFSDNGTLIYIPGASTGTSFAPLGLVTPQRVINSLPMPEGEYADPRVSRDGRWAAYTRISAFGADIEVFDLNGNASPRQLTLDSQSRYPAWSADGLRVAFQSTRDGTASLYWQRADGTEGEPVKLTTAADGEAHVPDSFSPDGRWLTYTVMREGVPGIWLLDLESNQAEELISVPGQSVSQSVFSPDGRWLAYQTTEFGASSIVVQPFPLTSARFRLPATAEPHHPGWSADGSQIFYFPMSTRAEVIQVSTDNGFIFGTPQALPNLPGNEAPGAHRQYDVMPDGSGLLTVVPPSSAVGQDQAEIRIVFNWFEELKELVPVE